VIGEGISYFREIILERVKGSKEFKIVGYQKTKGVCNHTSGAFGKVSHLMKVFVKLDVKLMIPIMMHQMHISTNQVPSVVLRLKNLEIQKL
jgi:hypothetical protein